MSETPFSRQRLQSPTEPLADRVAAVLAECDEPCNTSAGRGVGRASFEIDARVRRGNVGDTSGPAGRSRAGSAAFPCEPPINKMLLPKQHGRGSVIPGA